MNNHVLNQDTCSFQHHTHAAIYNISKLKLAISNAIVTNFQKLQFSKVNRIRCCYWAAWPLRSHDITSAQF